VEINVSPSKMPTDHRDKSKLTSNDHIEQRTTRPAQATGSSVPSAARHQSERKHRNEGTNKPVASTGTLVLVRRHGSSHGDARENRDRGHSPRKATADVNGKPKSTPGKVTMGGKPVMSLADALDSRNRAVKKAKENGQTIIASDCGHVRRRKQPKPKPNDDTEESSLGSNLKDSVLGIVNSVKGKAKAPDDNMLEDVKRQVREKEWDYPENGFPDSDKPEQKTDPTKPKSSNEKVAGGSSSRALPVSRSNQVYMNRNETTATLPPYRSNETLPPPYKKPPPSATGSSGGRHVATKKDSC
jgi:hypothetical protein